jgi:hypothetical protein
MIQETVSLSTVLYAIKDGNNGYVFASNMSPEYTRRANQLIDRGVIIKGRAVNIYNEMEDVFFTPESAKIHAHLINKV